MEIQIPADERVEIIVLSALMNNSLAASECFISLEENDFFYSKSQQVFRLFKQCFNTNEFDILSSMMFQLSKDKSLNSAFDIDLDYILSISQNHWSGMDYMRYIAELKNATSLRRVFYAGRELMNAACVPNALVDDVLSEHQNQLIKAESGKVSRIKSAKQLFEKYRDERSFPSEAEWRYQQFLAGKPTFEGVASGYPILDDTLGNFQNSCLYYIGARTSMGKTTFILNLIRNMLINKRIGVFSLEMPANIIFAKLVCMICSLPYADFVKGNLSPERIRRFKDCQKLLSDCPLFIEDEDSMGLSKLVMKAKRMKQVNKIDILFIDYLTLIKSITKYPLKHLQIDEISKALQSLAKVLQIPVICLAQLNRQVTSREHNRPTLADFRESGSIEEDADGCILLHRPEYYEKSIKKGIIEVIIAKNRLMGTLKTIEFSCIATESEVYRECGAIAEEIQRRNISEASQAFASILDPS